MEILSGRGNKEGYDIKTLQSIMSLADDCGFKRMISHVFVEVVKERLDLLINGIKEEDSPPLMEDTIYCFCDLDWKKENQESPYIIELLKEGNDKSNGEVIVRVPSLHIEEAEKRRFINGVRKDIVFIGGKEALHLEKDEEIGFYNRKANMLWLSDLAHDKGRAVNNLKIVLDSVYSLRETK